MADFTMPALGADMEAGKVVEWRVKPGDAVHPGDVVAVVETHKGAIDVECFLDGIIDQLVPLGTELPVGAVLASVRTNAGGAGQAAPDAAVAPLADAPRPRISPAARRKAAALHVPVERLQGSGADGTVTLADVANAAPAAHPVAKAGFDPLLMRQAIAAAMGKSKREIPHYYLTSTTDFGPAQNWLDAWNSTHEPADRLLPAVLFLKASAKALQAVPQLNGFYKDGTYLPASSIHPGWAVSLRGGGLVAPAIHDADRQTPAELMTALRGLVQRARSGGLRSSELTDPTVTITNLGDRGAESVLGVIYPPQVAIIGFGRVAHRPWVVEGAVVARPVVNISLAADHRTSDGHLGGQLLAAIDAHLQHPERL